MTLETVAILVECGQRLSIIIIIIIIVNHHLIRTQISLYINARTIRQKTALTVPQDTKSQNLRVLNTADSEQSIQRNTKQRLQKYM